MRSSAEIDKDEKTVTFKVVDESFVAELQLGKATMSATAQEARENEALAVELLGMNRRARRARIAQLRRAAKHAARRGKVRQYKLGVNDE